MTLPGDLSLDADALREHERLSPPLLDVRRATAPKAVPAAVAAVTTSENFTTPRLSRISSGGVTPRGLRVAQELARDPLCRVGVCRARHEQ